MFNSQDTRVHYTIKYFEKTEDNPLQNTLQCVIGLRRVGYMWYLIAPTGTPLTLTGLKVGEFTVVASHAGYKLVVTHGPLVKTGNDPVSYDYELGVSYAIGGITYTKICLATDNPAMADPDHKITISLRSGDSVVVIQNAGIYFRMTNGNVITTVGNYASTVTFTLEAET